jgi:hypothetical protein
MSDLARHESHRTLRDGSFGVALSQVLRARLRKRFQMPVGPDIRSYLLKGLENTIDQFFYPQCPPVPSMSSERELVVRLAP